jgi:hypothetical protein
MVSFTDVTASAWTGNSEPHSLASTSKATICATPAASTVREIDHVTISASGGANTVIVLQTISATEYQLISVALSSGDTLEYTHASGWRVTDSNGSIRQTFSNITGNLAVGGALAVTGASTLAAVTASGLGAFNAGLTVASGQTLTLTGATVAGAPTWSSSQAITLSTAAQPNITSVGTLTSLAVTGTLGVSAEINANAANYGITLTPTVGTSQGAMRIINTGGTTYFGVDNSGGGAFNSSAYAAVIYSPNAIKLLAGAGTGSINISAAGATTVTGTLGVSSLGAFAASDKYVIVDSSGNFHKSALGPLS